MTFLASLTAPLTPFQVIATSGPSSTYPQRAYRNPTDALVKFLDSKHDEHWSIWEFRAEGTGYPDSEVYGRIRHYPWPDHHPPPFALIPNMMASMRDWLKGPDAPKDRVVVVHCKAGKGRSGTAVCSYLISEENWKMEDALLRFTERRMRSGFGAGVSIPSQLRWVGYVDRWKKHGKIYVERRIEVLEVHIWGLRDGVKVGVEGYIDEGKKIKNFHIFGDKERILEGYNQAISSDNSSTRSSSPAACQRGNESGGSTVILKPSSRVILPSNDINIDFERRNKAAYGWTMVTSVAHVWFNAFFEGGGPENYGEATPDGVFEIEWDAIDGIRGSPRKGMRALDHLAVLWRAVADDDTAGDGGPRIITEPQTGEPVPEARAADWKGANPISDGGLNKDLGLRSASPASTQISKASSVASLHSVKSEDDPATGLRSHLPPDNDDHVSHSPDTAETPLLTTVSEPALPHHHDLTDPDSPPIPVSQSQPPQQLSPDNTKRINDNGLGPVVGLVNGLAKPGGKEPS